jgi:hypothetical protein
LSLLFDFENASDELQLELLDLQMDKGLKEKLNSVKHADAFEWLFDSKHSNFRDFDMFSLMTLNKLDLIMWMIDECSAKMLCTQHQHLGLHEILEDLLATVSSAIYGINLLDTNNTS